jgi:hypothetical protein
MDADPSCSLQPDTTYPTDGSLETIRLSGTSVACATYDSALERIMPFSGTSGRTIAYFDALLANPREADRLGWRFTQ